MTKFNTYIAVFGIGSDGASITFVTGIQNYAPKDCEKYDIIDYLTVETGESHVDRRTVLWEYGKEAMRFSEEWAREIVWGMALKGYFAGVVKFPALMKIRNREQ